jgi:hypothetical protein
MGVARTYMGQVWLTISPILILMLRAWAACTEGGSGGVVPLKARYFTGEAASRLRIGKHKAYGCCVEGVLVEFNAELFPNRLVDWHQHRPRSADSDSALRPPSCALIVLALYLHFIIPTHPPLPLFLRRGFFPCSTRPDRGIRCLLVLFACGYFAPPSSLLVRWPREGEGEVEA